MDFTNISDQETFFSFKRLIDDNNGFFKSYKQSKFFARSASKDIYEKIYVEEDQSKVLVSGYVRFADYGFKSVRRVEWVYVIDAVGVVEQFKLKFRYSADGRYSEACDAESIWKRPSGIELPEFAIIPDQISEWVGTVGSRTKFKAKILSKHPVETAYGVSYLITLKTEEGNILKYWNSIYKTLDNGSRYYAEVGDTAEFMAGVKAHGVYNDKKETIICRVTKANII